MEGSSTIFCSSKFPWIREIISSKFIDILGTRLQKYSPALVWSFFSPRKYSRPRHTEVPSTLTPTPCHFTTPSRPVRQPVPLTPAPAKNEATYCTSTNARWTVSGTLPATAENVFGMNVLEGRMKLSLVTSEKYHTFLFSAASRSDHFTSTDKPRTCWIAGCVFEEPVRVTR